MPINLTNNRIPPANYNELTTQNSASEINKEQIPFSEDILRNIVKYCDIDTAYNLSRVCLLSYRVITPLLPKLNYQKKVPYNSIAYSIEAYRNFISPILSNLDHNAKTKIDKYLQQNKDKQNINKLFPVFAFKQLNNTATKLLKSKGLVIDSFLAEVSKFIVSSKSNHCALVSKKYLKSIDIYQLHLSLETEIEKEILTTIDCHLKRFKYISEIQFTPQNNLLVTIKDKRSDIVKLALFKLNLEDNAMQPQQLWHYALTNYSDYTSITVFPHSNDEKLLITTEISSNPKNYLLIIQNYNPKIEEFVLYNNNLLPYKEITDFIFSDNGLELASLMKTENFRDIKKVHLFSRNNNTENFIEKSLPLINDHREISMYSDLFADGKDLQFNKTGDLCIFISGWEVVMLNKIDGEWHFSMILQDYRHCSIRLAPDEKNLFLLRESKDIIDDNHTTNLDVMPIEDKILKSVPALCYIRNDPSFAYFYTPSNKPNIKLNNFYSLEKNSDAINFKIHSSGLALFTYNEEENKVKAIIPQQITAKDKLNIRLAKAIYYPKYYAKFLWF